jgi:uncharacterized protein YciW
MAMRIQRCSLAIGASALKALKEIHTRQMAAKVTTLSFSVQIFISRTHNFSYYMKTLAKTLAEHVTGFM